MGPVIGPVAGGYVSDGLGWRWVFWIIAIAVRLAFHDSLLRRQRTAEWLLIYQD